MYVNFQALGSQTTVSSFLSTQVLGVLSQDGIMRFVNIQTFKLLFEIGSVEEGISSSVISPHGRYIASIMENGSLNIYSVQALTQEINKVCPPVTDSALCISISILYHQGGNISSVLFSNFFRTHLFFWLYSLALKSCISSSDFSPGSFSAWCSPHQCHP